MPKLLWISPLSVHDTTSASAIQMRNMLLSLHERKVDLIALSALNFTQAQGTSMFVDLEEKLKGKETYFNLNDNGINFVYIRTRSRNLASMTSQEQRNFYGKLCGLINSFKPDLIMGTGTDMLSMVCFDEAKRRNIPTAYLLLDGTPRHFNFPNIDLVLTDSSAVANLYAVQYKINAVVTGSFLPVEGDLNKTLTTEELNNFKKQAKKRYRITMINPSLNKGVSIFLRMAQLATKDFRKYRFTILETEPNQVNQALVQLKEQGSKHPAFNQDILEKVEILSNANSLNQVFKETAVLVIPSLSFESSVRFAREAISWGIPVLANNLTGIAESIGQAGILVVPPAYCMQDPKIVPNKKDINNYLKALKMILAEDYTEKCQAVTQSYDLNIAANRLFTTLKPLLDKKAGNNPQLIRLGSLI